MTRRRSTESSARSLSAMQRLLSQTFSRYAGQGLWSPAVNVYQLADRWEVCMDVAGVDRADLEVQVQPGRLLIRGQRTVPEPSGVADEKGKLRILAMEIDSGAFSRTVRLPGSVKLDAVQSHYRDGLLWVILPMA